MAIKVPYDNEAERINIIQQYQTDGLYLVADCRHGKNEENKFLIFDTEPLADTPDPGPTIEEILLIALLEIQQLKQKVAELEGGQ